MTKQLVPKIDRFVDEYLVDLNGTQAAIRAGYSEKTAAQQASRLLRNVKVQQAITTSQKQLAEKGAWDVERLVDEAETDLMAARAGTQVSSASGALEIRGRVTGLLNEKHQPGQVQVTKIVINLAPGVKVPAEVVEATEYREIPEGNES